MFFWSTTIYSSTYYDSELWNILHVATLIANIHILNKQKTQFPGAGTIPSFGGCELVLAAEVAQNIGMKEKPLGSDSGSPLEHSQYRHWETGTTGGNLNHSQPPRCPDKLGPAASVPVPAWWPQNQLQQQLHFASLCATSTSNAGATSRVNTNFERQIFLKRPQLWFLSDFHGKWNNWKPRLSVFPGCTNNIGLSDENQQLLSPTGEF